MISEEQTIRYLAMLKRAGYSASEAIEAISAVEANASKSEPKIAAKAAAPVEMVEVKTPSGNIVKLKHIESSDNLLLANNQATVKAASSAVVPQKSNWQTPAGYKGSSHRTVVGQVDYIYVNGKKTAVKGLYRYGDYYIGYISLGNNKRMSYLCNSDKVAIESDTNFNRLKSKICSSKYHY